MIMPNRKLDFCRKLVHLQPRQLIQFDGRPYLRAIYAAQAGNQVLRCARQTEKSTFLVNTILYELCLRPGIRILFVSPRKEQSTVFIRSRLLPCLEQSPIIRRTLLGASARRPSGENMSFHNGSSLFVRAAFHSADAARGISSDLLLVDEFQDIAAGDLPVLQETLSHSEKDGRTLLTGTPKLIDNHLDAAFQHSTANEWTVHCTHCEGRVIFDQHSLGASGVVCPGCQTPVDPASGRWVPRNPGSRWGEGFWVNHLMVPWVSYDDILEKQRVYDPTGFRNEVLGLSTTLGDHLVTRAELEACCQPRRMAESLDQVPEQARVTLIAGIDWGGGTNSRTVLVIGWMRSDYVFEVLRMDRFRPDEDPAYVVDQLVRRCRQFRIRWIAADGRGNGFVYNRNLFDRIGGGVGLYGLIYAVSSGRPEADGVIQKWSVDRSATLGHVFTRIKKQSVLFPHVEDSSSFLDEIACEVAVHDDHNRTVKFTHPDTQPDDALHALNYALILGVYLHSRSFEMSP